MTLFGKAEKVAVAAVAGIIACCGVNLAFAIDIEELSAEAERTADAYDAAVAERDRIASEITGLEEQISIKEGELGDLQRKADASAVALYKMGQDRDVLIEMLLESDSLQKMIYAWDSYDEILNHYNENIQVNSDARRSLADDKLKLEADKAAADVAVEEAGAAMEAAREARQEAQEAAQARATSEADAALAAEINWNMSKDEFVNHWGDRIDSYLSGSPLEGYGKNFAEAAYTYGVDPRWSPAISYIESGKAVACFLPHNAWGYLGHSWDSWEEAIDAHVKYLSSSLYGGYLSSSGAATYCPPGPSWHDKCYNEMKKI